MDIKIYTNKGARCAGRGASLIKHSEGLVCTKDKYGKNCDQGPLLCFRSGFMGRKCLEMRPQLSLASLSLNPSQFKEVFGF